MTFLLRQHLIKNSLLNLLVQRLLILHKIKKNACHEIFEHAALFEILHLVKTVTNHVFHHESPPPDDSCSFTSASVVSVLPSAFEAELLPALLVVFPEEAPEPEASALPFPAEVPLPAEEPFPTVLPVLTLP